MCLAQEKHQMYRKFGFWPYVPCSLVATVSERVAFSRLFPDTLQSFPIAYFFVYRNKRSLYAFERRLASQSPGNFGTRAFTDPNKT